MPVTRDAWVEAVRSLLERRTVVERKTKDGKTETVEIHETDPPENFRPPRGMKVPGPLPELVEEREVAKGARTETHSHAVPAGADLDHCARVVVTEARRIQARGVALRDPVDLPSGGSVLTVVLVL